MNSRVVSLSACLTMALTSCAVPHGWKVTHEDVAFRRDSTGAVVEKIDCETHLTHQLYSFSPEGMMADKWVEHHRDFYLVRADKSRMHLACIPGNSNPRFFPVANDEWFVIWPNDEGAPAYSENLAVALVDAKDTHQKEIVRGCYYLTKAWPPENVVTSRWKPIPEGIQPSDFNYQVDIKNGNAIFRTYNGDLVFNFSDGTLKPL